MGHPRPARMWSLVPVAALLLYAAVLRAPLVVISPLLPVIRDDLGITAAQAGLLTSIPVLCFGLLTPVASRLLRLVGINHAALYGLAGIIVGSALRSTGGITSAYVGTAIIGAAIAIGNVAVPMLIGRQFRHRAALLTGAYSSTTNIAVAAATALAVPMALWLGWRWAVALGGLVLGLVALAAWIAVYPPGVRGARASVRRRAGLTEPVGRVRITNHRPEEEAHAAPLRRWRVTWLLAAAFAGHTLAYYALTAWLPTILIETQGMTESGAGGAASLFQAGGILGPVIVPAIIAGLGWSTQRVLSIVCACWLVMPVGMLAAGEYWAVWSVVAGAAQGAFFTALFMIVIQRARDIDENRRLSTIVQTAGYSVAAIGPVAVGWLNEATGSWNVVLACVVGVLVVTTVCALTAARDTSAPPA